MSNREKKSIKTLESDLQKALNANAIRDYNFFGNFQSIYRPYIIVNLRKDTPRETKQKIIEYIYETYDNIHCVELVNQQSCICIDYEKGDKE